MTQVQEISLAADAVGNYSIGSPIPDEQLTAGIVVLSRTIEFLTLLGEKYRLTYSELRRVRDNFREFQEYRKRDVNKNRN